MHSKQLQAASPDLALGRVRIASPLMTDLVCVFCHAGRGIDGCLINVLHFLPLNLSIHPASDPLYPPASENNTKHDNGKRPLPSGLSTISCRFIKPHTSLFFQLYQELHPMVVSRISTFHIIVM